MRTIIIIIGLLVSSQASADLIFQFRNPAFNGANWSGHVLTIEQQEKARRDEIRLKSEAQQALIKSEAQNSPLNRFMSLFQSQVYSQLATQLSNNLFASGNSNTGSFQLDGNSISYIKSGTDVRLTIVDQRGNLTEITVPIASFAF